ncbi:hypothetical protein QE152_g34354 [Popillia japonica]|uniref:Uncharacterized protein n=1 Tax=Popillia japonica TaxID=7064 RepID=A0AAW1ITX1_POPJA
MGLVVDQPKQGGGNQMGLVVDQPKQGGGNSNDGNTARKFFAEPTKSGAIAGLDPELIKRFANILSLLSCGFIVNYVSFKNYCIETAKMCLDLHNWYKISASVHKLLIHGADIIKELPLPGYLCLWGCFQKMCWKPVKKNTKVYDFSMLEKLQNRHQYRHCALDANSLRSYHCIQEEEPSQKKETVF